MIKSPLFIGTDLRNVSAETKAIFLNKDVIALNQDPLGVQARLRTSVDHNYQVWSGELSDGDFAVLVLSLRQPDRDKPATRRRVLDPLQKVSRAFSRVMGWMGLRNFGDTMVTVTSEELGIPTNSTGHALSEFGLRDLWAARSLGALPVGGALTLRVGAEDCRVVRLHRQKTKRGDRGGGGGDTVPAGTLPAEIMGKASSDMRRDSENAVGNSVIS
eukprot:Selendium_serpulae@DN5606_c1_g1_i4.p1